MELFEVHSENACRLKAAVNELRLSTAIRGAVSHQVACLVNSASELLLALDACSASDLCEYMKTADGGRRVVTFDVLDMTDLEERIRDHADLDAFPDGSPEWIIREWMSTSDEFRRWMDKRQGGLDLDALDEAIEESFPEPPEDDYGEEDEEYREEDERGQPTGFRADGVRVE